MAQIPSTTINSIGPTIARLVIESFIVVNTGGPFAWIFARHLLLKQHSSKVTGKEWQFAGEGAGAIGDSVTPPRQQTAP
jgi:hypothetical protein